MERLQQIEEIFQEALQRDPEERGAYVRQACGGDAELQREVVSLLAHHDKGDPEAWAAAAAARLIDPPGSLQPGQSLGPYRIETFLAAGGMGEVYRATDTRLNRTVAIKISAARFSERFEREARMIASLNHPNICQLYDVGPNYLVMEMVEGPTLADRIRQGAVPLEEALAIARQISDALEAAHDRGIVHRDLKPENVKIKPDGTVKVLDFGLAKMADPPEAGEGTENSPTVTLDSAATRTGVILGTAAYMCPEQVRGKRVDKRADIWAFGVLLYEMLTGQRLFEGETVSDTLIEVATKEPDWTRIPAAPGRNVRRLVRHCLEKDPKRRLRDIGEAWFVLEEVAQLSGLQPGAQSRGRDRWLAWGVAALSFAIAGLVSFIHFREKPPVAELIRFQIPGRETTFFLPKPAVSPNGRMIAFSGLGPAGRNVLWVRSLDTVDARALPETEGAGSDYFWSPDSRFVGFGAQGTLKRVAVSGGTAQTLCPIPRYWTGGAWSRNGVIIFGLPSHGLVRVSENGGATSPVTVLGPAQGNAHAAPAFLPDGQHFIYTRFSDSAEGNGIYLGSLDTSPERQSSRRLVTTISDAAYAPSQDPAVGYLLFVRGTWLFAQPFDNRRMELMGEAVPVAEGFGPERRVNFSGQFSVSENGVLAYRAGSRFPNTQLRWFDRTGKMLGAVEDPGRFDSLALSPDGKTAAVAHGSGGALDIWLHEFTHDTRQRLTSDPAAHWMAVWSPDGSQLAFASNVSGVYDIFQEASSGAGTQKLLLKSSEAKFPYDWSADGRWLLYGSLTSQYDLWYLPLKRDERNPVLYLASGYNKSQARFSPDGRLVAYTSDESGENEVYIQTFPEASEKWTISKGGGNQPHWRRDGKELFYVSADSRMMAVDVTPTPVFAHGNPKALFPVPIWGGATSLNVTRYDVTPDGQKFLINTLPADAAASASPNTVVLNWQLSLKK
jgi:Tol biopolymer transport system component/predicted Ser/Thr protein kinase